MTRFVLTSVLSLATASAAFAILPPLPPGVIFPPVPVAKDAPKAADAEGGEDVAKLADRIGQTAKGVSDKLGDRDTGDATRRDQAKLKQDLDKLIDLLQNPPMNNDSSQQPPPTGGDGGAPPPMGGQDQGKPPTGNGGQSNQPMGGMGNKPGQPQQRGSQRTGSGRRESKPMGGQPMPTPGGSNEPMGAKPQNSGQPMPMGSPPMPAGGDPMGKAGGSNQPGAGGARATPALPIAETIAKDFWGHLPELPRQQMMQFFREQYNSRYKDLLPDYFSTLAEKEKKGKK